MPASYEPIANQRRTDSEPPAIQRRTESQGTLEQNGNELESPSTPDEPATNTMGKPKS